VSRHAPDQRELERSASEHLVQRFGGEMRAASSSHDGVKGAVFPEFDARAPCGFEKIDKAAPIGGCYGPTALSGEVEDPDAPGKQIMELREPWARSRCPSGPTHRGSRTRENGRLCQYYGLPSRYSHRRFLRGAASLPGSREPKLGLRTWLLRSVQPTEVLA